MAINFKKLFQDAHIPIRNEGKNWINICCPYCKDPVDTHFNGGFNMISPHFNCWRCGSHSWYETLATVLHIDVHQVNLYVSSYKYVPSKDEIKKVAKGENLNLPGFHLSQGEKEYLVNRGFNVNYLIDKFHIRGGGIAGDWSYRILIPIYFNKVLVSWTGRSILTREQIKEYDIPRYKNLSIEQSVINPKEIFFNLDNSTKDSVIIVEGPFDVLKMGNDTICSLGTSTTREQELFLKKRYKKVFICFDNEPSAQKKAHKLGMNLVSIGMEVEVVNICEPFNKNDPGELEWKEILYIKKELGFCEK